MLTNHKNIVIPPECGFAIWFYDKYKTSMVSETMVKSFIKDLSTAKKIETWNLDYAKLLDYILAAKPASYPEVVGTVYEFYGHTIGRTFLRWGDKNNYYLNHIETISKMYPSARFVHIIRDGRDVACSYRALHQARIQSKYAPHLPDIITDIALEWKENISCAINSFEKIGWENVHELRYEDLVSFPTDELRKICSFLGEPYDKEMELYFYKNKEEQQEPVEFLQWKAKTIEKPTISEIGKYKMVLSKEEIKEFEDIASLFLRKYQYCLNIEA
jgi:hypothetical protein